MEKRFAPNSKLMEYGTKLGNLMWLQILVLVTSIPVLTVGASLSAMHTVLLKLYRDEENTVTKPYFKAFSSNFKQATLIWADYLCLFLLLYLDYGLVLNAENQYIKLALQWLPLPLALGCVSLTWVFVLQSRYENTILKTVKNSLLMCIFSPFYTLAMIVLSISPYIVAVLIPALIPIVLLMGMTLPGIACTSLYSKVFDKLEGTDWKTERLLQQN